MFLDNFGELLAIFDQIYIFHPLFEKKGPKKFCRFLKKKKKKKKKRFLA